MLRYNPFLLASPHLTLHSNASMMNIRHSTAITSESSPQGSATFTNCAQNRIAVIVGFKNPPYPNLVQWCICDFNLCSSYNHPPLLLAFSRELSKLIFQLQRIACCYVRTYVHIYKRNWYVCIAHCKGK